MHGIIIYKSKYGSTRQYAEWLQAETGFDLFDLAHCPRDLRGYDLVVLGSSVLAGRLALTGWIRKHWPALQDKIVLLLIATIMTDPKIQAKIVPQSLPDAIASRLTAFYVGGRYQLQRMSTLDRTMIKMVAALARKPEIKAELLAERDWVKQENLQGLLGHIRAMRN
jgi:menaquinone-dependent protoporphyrinogen IX oxidase